MSEAGNRITQLCLYPEQLDILNRSERRVFLSGPPGTGKTILLKLQGSVWLKKGHDVHVVSTRRESIASSFLLEYQFKMTLRSLVEGRATKPKLYRHCFDFVNSSRDIDTAVRQLSTKANKKNLRIIADEIGYLVDKRYVTCNPFIIINLFRLIMSGREVSVCVHVFQINLMVTHIVLAMTTKRHYSIKEFLIYSILYIYI